MMAENETSAVAAVILWPSDRLVKKNLLAHHDTLPTVQAFRFAASASRNAFCTSAWRASDA